MALYKVFNKRHHCDTIFILVIIIGTMTGCGKTETTPESSSEELSGQNTAAGELLNLSVGADEIINLGVGAEDIAGLSTEKTDDTSALAASTDIQEGTDTTVLNVMKEGMPEEIPATLYKGEGYSLYVTDGVWDDSRPDVWRAKANEKVVFYINNYEGLRKSQVERLLTAQGCVAENGELWGPVYDGEEIYAINRTICYETENDVWTINISYPPGEAEEGWLPEIRAIAETFTVDAGYDVGAHTAKATMPEGEQLKLYEVTYTDRRNRDWYSRDREEMKGYYIYDEITISNITDTTFDFTVTWSDPETDESGVIIPLSTAYINEDQISATYTGEDYTLTFDFSYINNPLPEVLWIRLWGVDELEGLLFTNTKIPGHEWE